MHGGAVSNKIPEGTYYIEGDPEQFKWAMAGVLRKGGLLTRDRVREWLAAPPPDERLFRSPVRWADLRKEERD
jgi:hypothetical protein